jgi:hypothetical protein
MFPFPAAMVLLMSSERMPLFCCLAMNNLEHEVSKIETHSGITIRYGLEVISLSPTLVVWYIWLLQMVFLPRRIG